MIYFAKNSGQKPGTASLEYPLFHGSLPPYGYQAVTNVDFAGLNDYFYSPTGWETFILRKICNKKSIDLPFCSIMSVSKLTSYERSQCSWTLYTAYFNLFNTFTIKIAG